MHHPTSVLFLLGMLAALPAQSPEGARHGAFVDAAGAIHAASASHGATFADAAALTVAGAQHDGPAATLQVRFVAATRGATRLWRDGTVQPTLTGDVVRWRHGPVTETCTLRPDGFEQSFVFAALPDGTGDLVVEIDATGNVTAPATVRTTHQPLEWHHGDRRVIRYGEASAFDGRGRRTEVATHYDGAGRITLVVPAAFVATAALPLVVDPVVGPVRVPAGPASLDDQPDVAYDPTSDRYLLVWRRLVPYLGPGGSTLYEPRVRGMLLNGDGVPTSPLLLVDDVHRCDGPAVALCRAVDPDSFVVAYATTTGLMGRVVGTTGTLHGAAFPITTAGATADWGPSLGGSDGAMVVAWQRGVAGTGIPTSIVLRGLFWSGTSPTGPVTLGSEQLIEQVTAGQVRNPRLAASCAQVTVQGMPLSANRLVWERFFPNPAPGDFDLRTTSFYFGAPSAFVVAEALGWVSGAAVVGVDETAPAIAAMASTSIDPTDLRFLIAWQDGSDVKARPYALTGTAGPLVDVRATPNYEGRPAVGAGQSEFTVAYLEQLVGSTLDVDVRAARVLPDGTVGQDHALVDDPGVVLQTGLRASSRPLPIPGQPLRNTTLLAWSGQTGPAIARDDVRTRLFEPVAPAMVATWAGCAGPGGTLPLIGTGGEVPWIGNADFGITLDNAPPTSLAALLIGQPTAVPLPGAPGCGLWVDAPYIAILGAFTDAAGHARIGIPIPLSLPLFDYVAFQWGVMVPGWNALGWIGSSDRMIAWYD